VGPRSCRARAARPQRGQGRWTRRCRAWGGGTGAEEFRGGVSGEGLVGGADEEELEGGTGGEELGGDNIGMSLGQHRTEKIMSERPVGVVFCFGFVVGVE
jgi:hypothetical protein